jgi:hypothetical protein
LLLWNNCADSGTSIENALDLDSATQDERTLVHPKNAEARNAPAGVGLRATAVVFDLHRYVAVKRRTEGDFNQACAAVEADVGERLLDDAVEVERSWRT